MIVEGAQPVEEAQWRRLHEVSVHISQILASNPSMKHKLVTPKQFEQLQAAAHTLSRDFAPPEVSEALS